MYLVAGGMAKLEPANRMQSQFQSNLRTQNLDPAVHERIAFLKDQRYLILAEIEQLKREPLQTTTIARRIDRLQQDYNRLVEEETALTPGPLCDPLDVLPPELWASIMPDSPDDIFNLTMISSRWCRALLSLPALWSTIILDNTKEDYWAKAIACLELSQPLEIAVRIKLPPELWTEIAPTILAESRRIRSMDFYEADEWVMPHFWGAFAKFETLPALRHLYLPRNSIVESQTSDCKIFRISPRLEQVTGFRFNAGALADPTFNTLRGVINIGPVDKEMAAALTGMNNLLSLHISWPMEGGAPSRNSGPLYLPSVTRFEYGGHSPIHALQFIGDNLVEFITSFYIRHILKLLMEVARFPVLRQLDVSVVIEVTDRLDPCDLTLATPSSSLRHLQLRFYDDTAWDHMAKQEAIEYVAGREEMFTSIFLLLVTTIPYVQTVRLTGHFMVDPALKYTRSLRDLQSLVMVMWPGSRLTHDNEIQRIACLPYILPPEFLNGHHSLSRLDLDNPALRSHYQVILTESLEELDFVPPLDMISSVPIPSVTTLSLVMDSPVLFGFDVFPNLQSINLSSYFLGTLASDFFEELILRPNQWPFLEKISLSGLYIEWDILILMLERRNFVTNLNVKRIKTLEFTNCLPYKLLYPITQLLKGKFVDRPPLIELSIKAIGDHLRDPTLTGCHFCIRTFRECSLKPHPPGVGSNDFWISERWLEWRYELPFERIHPDPPLSSEAVQCLEGKQRRRLEFKLSCKEVVKEFGRDFRCSESMAAPQKMTVGDYCMDGVFMDTVL